MLLLLCLPLWPGIALLLVNDQLEVENGRQYESHQCDRCTSNEVKDLTKRRKRFSDEGNQNEDTGSQDNTLPGKVCKLVKKFNL